MPLSPLAIRVWMVSAVSPLPIVPTIAQRYQPPARASTTARDNFAKHRIWAARTKDFKSFSQPFIYIEKPTAVIDIESLPLSAAAASLLARGAAGIEAIVSGGDDYEILCTVPEASFEAFARAAGLAGVAVTSIGTVIAGPEPPRFLDGQGREIAFKRLSYSHF